MGGGWTDLGNQSLGLGDTTTGSAVHKRVHGKKRNVRKICFPVNTRILSCKLTTEQLLFFRWQISGRSFG